MPFPRGVLRDLDLTGLERLPIGLTEEGGENLSAVLIPVDVEITGIRARAPMLQHVHPPVIVVMDGHVVRYDIEHDSEAMLAERSSEPTEAIFAAELWIDDAMIDDVVTMARTGARFQNGRRVDMADAKSSEIRRQRDGGLEWKPLVKLQAVGGARNHRLRGPAKLRKRSLALE